MRVKEILNNYELCLADIEVMLNGETRSAPTLCVTDGHEVIPLNTPDGRPIQMNKANAIQLGDGKWVQSFQSWKRFMSNPYLAVEKVTESLVGNTKVKLSLGLAANDKRREEVAFTQGLFSHTFLYPTGTKTSAVCPLQGSFLTKIKTIVRFSILEKETAQSVRL